jgi:hypothetical protein
VMSPYLLSNTPGAGTYYIDVAMDKNGGHLDGAKNYRLRVPANPPVKRFWAVTAYDPTTRGLLDAGGNFNKTVGSNEKPEMNPDGSVDVYFGPKAPEGKEKNWVPTNPKKGFFLVFRLYGPLEPFIEKTWVLGDLEEIK